ncbi:MAG: protein-L-isoaspartate(D-aspartate) O-methyltransferase [Planctomycetota bacterium]
MDEDDLSLLREEMVSRQLASRDIRDTRVLAAFRKVPRHLFVPKNLRSQAYDDHPVQIGAGQTISQPYMVALMTQCLKLTGVEKVLEVGTGSGYQSAILAELANEVYTIERFEELSGNARTVIESLGCGRIHFFVGDGTCGLPEHAPFDRIIVTAAAPDLPQPLVDQLAEGGILVIPTGGKFSQDLEVVTKKKGMLERRGGCRCVFVPLIGAYGYPG